MNTTKTLIAAALFAVIGTASAQEAIPATWANEVTSQQGASAKTRDEVKAELFAARARGELNTSSDNDGANERNTFVSSKTRAQVVAEFKAARDNGTLDARGEYFGVQGREAPFVSTRTSAEVKAELLQAQASGTALSRGDRTGG